MDNYNKNVLVPCPGCKRTFNPEALEKHLKGCKPGAAAKQEQDYAETANKVIVRPKTLVCYICGREFGTKSLDFHLKACRQKWDNEQM